ncbi:SPBc2 prophage-derived glycosyltransferase SunS [Clostridium ragsdalei P11]|uniref:SPBc2 prophage-derived glycosyltransferase SunS n=1 Tax=Clostridium ragsdalei P11 TaxID=1353534 RepID=A0A1A6AY99_9CLOT|nr:glycosyltransferase family 2 protein [Clostridium ragsdalei]OBR95005.1 SPBc2 prophage-derived glycosyltransferase SunS [Clostridium ragsdalei P11]
MKLSICMMVKDEEKNLERCLNSLKTIMSTIESELIIVDTGSQDRTIEIAKRYTDKVYLHKWNNDFSAMRNITINYAAGEWIFIIDADEEVSNENELITFLKSEKCNEYNTAIMPVENLNSIKDRYDYSVIQSPRLFKNDGEFHYKGVVHNYPIFKNPVIVIKAKIVHYGYINEDKSLMERKFSRTSKLLKLELEKDPNNIYYGFQLSVTYRMHDDCKDALDQIKKTYEIMNKDYINKKDFLYVYYQYVICLMDFKKYSEAEEVCREGLKLDNNYIDLAFYMAKSEAFSETFKKSIENYKRYITLVKEYNNSKLRYNINLGLYTLGRIEEAYNDLVVGYYGIGMYEKCLEYSKLLTSKEFIQNSIGAVVSSYIKLDRYLELNKYYEDVMIPNGIQFENKFNYVLEQCMNELEKGKRELLIKRFAGYSNSYSYLNKIRSSEAIASNDLKKIIIDFVNKMDMNLQPNYFGDLIYYMLKAGGDIGSLLYNVWDSKLNKFMEYLNDTHKDLSNLLIEYINSHDDVNNYNNVRINRLFCRYVLLIDNIDDKSYQYIFKKYIKFGISYVTTIYSKWCIDNKIVYDVKNNEDAFFIYLYHAQKCRDNNDMKGYYKYLRIALETYTYMKKGIEILMQNEKVLTGKEEKEFENYKTKLKQNISKLIDCGKLDNAQFLISQYEDIVKNDIEIYSMKAVIYMMQQKNSEAEKILLEGLKVDPDNADILFNLAYVYEMNQNYNKAIEYYKTAFFASDNKELKEKIRNIIKNLLEILDSNITVEDFFKSI